MWSAIFIGRCKQFHSGTICHLPCLSDLQGTSIIFPGWPIGFLVFLAYVASNHSISHALQQHAALHLLCYGIVFSKITNRLIVRIRVYLVVGSTFLLCTDCAHVKKFTESLGFRLYRPFGCLHQSIFQFLDRRASLPLVLPSESFLFNEALFPL